LGRIRKYGALSKIRRFVFLSIMESKLKHIVTHLPHFVHKKAGKFSDFPAFASDMQLLFLILNI